jgi:hypothetical protein
MKRSILAYSGAIHHSLLSKTCIHQHKIKLIHHNSSKLLIQQCSSHSHDDHQSILELLERTKRAKDPLKVISSCFTICADTVNPNDNISQTKEVVHALVAADVLTPETFYSALKLLKDDIEASLSLYHQSMDSGSTRVISPDSVSLLMRQLLTAGRADDALQMYQSTYEEHSNLPIDIFIANLVLRIYSKMDVSDEERVSGVMSMINRLKQDQVQLHHSTLAIAFKTLIEAKSIGSTRVLESIMKANGIPHNKITRQAMMQAFSSIEDYDSMMTIYHESIDARILPSSYMISEVIRLLAILGENAIAVRVLYLYLVHGGLLDWNLIETSLPIFRTNRRITSRKIYPAKKQAATAESASINDQPKQQTSPNSHLDYLHGLIVDMKSNFTENIYLYNQRKARLLETISRLIIKSIEIYDDQPQRIPFDIIFAMSPHIVIQGGIDKLLIYLKACQAYEPSRFWVSLMRALSENYPKEWRVLLQVYERMRNESGIQEQDRLDGLRYTAISMIRADNAVGAVSLLQLHLHSFPEAAVQRLRNDIKNMFPKDMRASEIYKQLDR